MKLPWVSRRAFELVIENLERITVERDAYRDRGDRLYDETILRFGYEAATPKVRQEMAQAAVEYEAAIHIDDPFGDTGGLDADLEAAVDLAVKTSNPV